MVVEWGEVACGRLEVKCGAQWRASWGGARAGLPFAKKSESGECGPILRAGAQGETRLPKARKIDTSFSPSQICATLVRCLGPTPSESSIHEYVRPPPAP